MSSKWLKNSLSTSVCLCRDTGETLTSTSSQWISNNNNLSDWQKMQLRKLILNQHMPGVVYCDSRFNWVLAPLHPGDSCCSLLHSQMSRSAMSYCDLAVRHSQHQSGVTLGSPSAPDKLWFALQRCLSHWLLQGGASLIICRNDTAERCFKDVWQQSRKNNCYV